MCMSATGCVSRSTRESNDKKRHVHVAGATGCRRQQQQQYQQQQQHQGYGGRRTAGCWVDVHSGLRTGQLTWRQGLHETMIYSWTQTTIWSCQHPAKVCSSCLDLCWQSPSARSMLDQHLRSWSNIESAMAQCTQYQQFTHNHVRWPVTTIPMFYRDNNHHWWYPCIPKYYRSSKVYRGHTGFWFFFMLFLSRRSHNMCVLFFKALKWFC